MSPPRSSSAPGSAGHVRSHRLQRARRGEPLADAAEVDSGAPLDASRTRGVVDIDLCAGIPCIERSRRTLGEQLEGAVVSGRDERRKDGRVEATVRVDTRAQRRRERLDQTDVDLDPGAARAVQQ